MTLSTQIKVNLHKVSYVYSYVLLVVMIIKYAINFLAAPLGRSDLSSHIESIMDFPLSI
jgi:hypothetical protein